MQNPDPPKRHTLIIRDKAKGISIRFLLYFLAYFFIGAILVRISHDWETPFAIIIKRAWLPLLPVYKILGLL